MNSLRDFTDDLARSVAFLSRIHMPQRHFIGFDGRLGRAVRAFPLAGLMITLPAAALLSMLSAFHASALLAAMLALALQTMITGALHEDGLADTADGLGGGRTREKALAIMKDSRIGTYGAIGLVLSFGIRAAAIAALLPQLTPTGIGLCVLASATLSRAAMVWHWSRLPPARADGVAASVGAPDPAAVSMALGSALAIAVILLALSHMSIVGMALVLAAFAATPLVFGGIVDRKIGGHTGDTIGAAQQLTEIAILVALAVAA